MWKGGASFGFLQDGVALLVGFRKPAVLDALPSEDGMQSICRQEGGEPKCSCGEVSVPLCPLSLIEFLLYRGKADLTVLDENKNTALHLACSKVLPGVVAMRAA